MSHSPAPWRIRRPTESEITGGVRKYPAIVAADGFSVCSFGATAKHGKRSVGTVEADVALTVAGPDMLAALRPLLFEVEQILLSTRHHPDCAVKLSRKAAVALALAAIARAEGRTA
jgi:hypothetical protein